MIQKRLTELLYSVAARVDTGNPPDPYDDEPEMNGTADAGTSDYYARGDHVHPSDTTKADIEDEIIKVSTNLSSLPVTISDDAILADHVVLDLVLGTPSAMGSDWTFLTANGSLTISGTINQSTSATIILGRNGN